MVFMARKISTVLTKSNQFPIFQYETLTGSLFIDSRYLANEEAFTAVVLNTTSKPMPTSESKKSEK